MRVLFVDDNVYASSLSQALIGHIVDGVNNLSDAQYKITDSPGAAAYGALILDIDMPAGDLPKKYREEALNSFAGWVFYERILSVYPKLRERTIIFTAFECQLESIIGHTRYQNLKVVDKTSPDLITKANRLLRDFEKMQS